MPKIEISNPEDGQPETVNLTRAEEAEKSESRKSEKPETDMNHKDTEEKPPRWKRWGKIGLLLALPFVAGWWARDRWGRDEYTVMNYGTGTIRINQRTGETWKLPATGFQWRQVGEPTPAVPQMSIYDEIDAIAKQKKR